MKIASEKTRNLFLIVSFDACYALTKISANGLKIYLKFKYTCFSWKLKTGSLSSVLSHLYLFAAFKKILILWMNFSTR